MNRTLLVTGGGRGIGRAVALGAARRGWSVAVNYVRDRAAAETVAEAVRALGARSAVLPGDVADPKQVTALFDAAEAALGPINGVVINAGRVGPAAPLADMTDERLRGMVEVNLLGALFTAREAARRMSTDRGGQGGAMVLVSSAAARLGSPDLFVDYAATKGALDTLTVGLAQELGPRGVRVNAVRPGVIETDIHASGGEPDRAARVGATTPLRRAGTAEETADAILWLLDDQASYVSGALLDVAGGR